MKQSKKLFGGLFRNPETGPFHNSRNIYPYVFDTTYQTSRRKLLLGSAAVVGAGLLLFGTFQATLIGEGGKFSLGDEWTNARKAKELSMGWFQEEYWKRGDPIYLPKSKDSDHIDDNSPIDWPIEKALANLDSDEWWDKFESTRPKGWINVLPQVFDVMTIKRNSMEGEEDEDEEGEEAEGGSESFFVIPYNFYNPTSPLPSDRPEYRRVMEVVTSGLPKRSEPVPELYRNDMGGCTAIIDPDGPKPIKVTFSNDWRDLSPEALRILRERLIWKYQDDFNNYAPPQISSQLRDQWTQYLSVRQQN
jgi:hypothetical protein